MKIKHLILFFILVFAFLSAGLFLSHLKIVSVDGKKFIAELALTQEEQKKGLGGRSRLCRNCAMLFDFREEGRRSFWMKDMNFDLDIIWIRDSRVVYIQKNFSRESSEIVEPPFPADKVLEINSGLSDQYGFEAGDEVKVFY